MWLNRLFAYTSRLLEPGAVPAWQSIGNTNGDANNSFKYLLTIFLASCTRRQGSVVW